MGKFRRTVLVQVSTQQGDHVAEALCFVRGATVVKDPKTGVLSFQQTELAESGAWRA